MYEFGTYFRREGGYGSSRAWYGRMRHDPSHSQAMASLCQNRPMHHGSLERRSQDTAVGEERYPLESENESVAEVDKQQQTKKT